MRNHNKYLCNILSFLSVFLLAFLISSASFAFRYSTNFMWINKAIVSNNTYVFPELRTKEGWNVKVIDWMEHWLKANPNGNFVFWFDKDTVTQEQIKNTKEKFATLRSSLLKNGTLELKDIHESKIVADLKNAKYFSAKTPLYLRVDLLRVALGLDYLRNCEEKEECVYVYADVDKGLKRDGTVYDLSTKALFDDETNKDLKKFGLVMRTGPENSFFMISNHKKNMLEALEVVVLQSNFKRIDRLLKEEQALREGFKNDELKKAPIDKNFSKIPGFDQLTRAQKSQARTLGQSAINDVFNSMVRGPLLAMFHYLEGDLQLLVNQRVMDAGGFAEIFSKMALTDDPTPLRQDADLRLIRYFKVGEEDFSKAEKEGGELLESDNIPQKYIGGSESQSYSLGW